MVPYRDLVTNEFPQRAPEADDAEKNLNRRTFKSTGSSSSINAGGAGGAGALTSPETPFFHFDLASAVQAAELGALKPNSNRVSEDNSYSKQRE